MNTFLSAAGALLATVSLCCHAQTNDLQVAVASFPKIWASAYHPEVAARCANVFLKAGEEKACAALVKAVNTQPELYVNACHLCRLLFTSANRSQPLRRPGLGHIMGFPGESIIRDPPEWPDLPFVVAEGIPLSLCPEGYAGSGFPQSAEKYIEYCRANGRFRTNLFAIPTLVTASNALVSVYESPAWKSLNWKEEDQVWRPVDEGDTKRRLWAQVNNLANPQGGANRRQPPNSETKQTSPPAASGRSP